ncbi:MAG TPA: sigma-70 family RNA polymerase sigma factor [Actinomycetota bacterium]|nr:sigma-70 family RNA polymerase sigma factor [Actinomycetota bacterium]
MDRDLEHLNDAELVTRFVAGEEPAFAALMRRHEDRVFALALRMTGDRADALDATQDAFIQAFRRAPGFRGDSAFGTWLYRIAINACHDLLRKRGRAPVPEAELPERADTARVDDATAARVDIAAALARLQEDYRTAVVLHDLGGVPYEEIAVETGVSIGTVKSRISRGRRRLAALLEQSAGPRPSEDSTP